jgi:hypothetical protein
MKTTETRCFRTEYRMTDHKLSANIEMRSEVLAEVSFKVMYGLRGCGAV